jgi:hypothetical protein
MLFPLSSSLAGGCLLFAACSSPAPLTWVKPSATLAEWHHDSEECHRQNDFLQGSRGTVTLHMGFYEKCLKAAGWTQVRGRSGNT